MADDEVPIQTKISLNLADMLRIAQIGIWRASAFLKIGLHDLRAENFADFDLNDEMGYRFWPNPLPKETAEATVDEYRHWLIGSCLKELDQYFSIFLDQAWRVLEVAALHNQRVASSYAFDQKFAESTNVAKKLKRVAVAVGFEPEVECFNSLSLARNALAHGAGRVRKRDCSEEGALLITWVAPNPVIEDGDKKVPLRDVVKDGYQIEAPNEARVLVRFDRLYARFALGEKIDLSHQNLADICFFYYQQASLVHKNIHEHMRHLGIANMPIKEAFPPAQSHE